MENLIDNFYQNHVKSQESVLADALNRHGKWKILMGIIFYSLFIVILIIITIFNQFTSVASQGNAIIILVFVILTIIFMFYVYRMYLQVSTSIPVKKRLLKKLHLREKGSIDALHYTAAEILYFMTFIGSLVLLSATFTYPFFFIISIIIISGISVLIYWTTLTHKSKIRKESIIIRKFFTWQKLEIRWCDIQEAMIKGESHIEKQGGYIIYYLYLKTTITDESIKIYLGRDQMRTILEIIPAFIRYMSKVQSDSLIE